MNHEVKTEQTFPDWRASAIGVVVALVLVAVAMFSAMELPAHKNSGSNGMETDSHSNTQPSPFDDENQSLPSKAYAGDGIVIT